MDALREIDGARMTRIDQIICRVGDERRSIDADVFFACFDDRTNGCQWHRNYTTARNQHRSRIEERPSAFHAFRETGAA